jgi:hypothetical protein
MQFPAFWGTIIQIPKIIKYMKHKIWWLYAGARELNIENKNFTFVFIENLAILSQAR